MTFMGKAHLEVIAPPPEGPFPYRVHFHKGTPRSLEADVVVWGPNYTQFYLEPSISERFLVAAFSNSAVIEIEELTPNSK